MDSERCDVLYLSQREKQEFESIRNSTRWFQEITSIWQACVMRTQPSSIVRNLCNKSVFTGNLHQFIVVGVSSATCYAYESHIIIG